MFHYEIGKTLIIPFIYKSFQIRRIGTGLGLESGRGVVMKTNQLNQFAQSFLKWAAFVTSVSIFWGCSAVKFSTKASCEGAANCVVQAGSVVYGPFTETITGGKVDVLFVNDNSASMSFEQARLAQRFNQFVAQFDQRLIDYRMAVTTTDISSGQNVPRSINQSGALQDGKLISFSNSQKYLVPGSGSSPQKEQMFNQVINRPETLSCEQFIINYSGSRDTSAYSQAYYNACPSTDERGIFAANLVVQNNPDSFIRPEADLAIIFLADEDERSQMYWHNIAGFELSNLDKSATLFSQIKAKYPQKTLGIHAFIVKDQTCLNQQNAQTNGLVGGSYGWEYYNATLAGSGVAGDICANDYTQQLQSVFNNIQGKIVDKIALKCAAPQLQIENITLSTNDPSISPSVVGAEIRFNKKLPVGTSVTYKYKCTQGAQ